MSKKQKLDLNDFLTSPLRDEETTSIITNLFNRFFSEEKSVRINGQIGLDASPTEADISAPDFDRDQNVLTPALYFKTGTEESIFTFDDLVHRLEAIGVDINNLQAMLKEQSFNFAPPIDLDKFINYSNYYWIGKRLPMPALSWNETVDPEYYVIARPPLDSIYKMPVKLATTRDIKLWGKDRPREVVTVLFTSPTTFTVTGDQGVLYTRLTSTVGTENTAAKTLAGTTDGAQTIVYVVAPDATNPVSLGYGLNDTTTTNDELFSFTITHGSTAFTAGDNFEIDIEYITGASNIAFSSSVSGKGFVSNIVPDTNMMYVDGVRVVDGDTVLVWQQTNQEENGVYTVRHGRWERRTGVDLAEYLPLGSLVYVLKSTGAATYQGYTFELTTREPASTFILDDPVHGELVFTVNSTTAPAPVNEWQAYNYWVHRDVLIADHPASTQEIAIKATRPIIEYSRTIKLNEFVDANGYPATTGAVLTQRKTQFNQIPQFDLFYYDGTHSKKTSSIFFYVEDPDYPVDVELQKRAKTTINSDYIFGIGIEDEQKRLLYWKNGADLQTIWAKGPASPT